MSVGPKPYPTEFRDDAVAESQRREAAVTIKQIAEDFGSSEGYLQNWLPGRSRSRPQDRNDRVRVS